LLGDPSRRAIFELLSRRPRSVGELAEELPITRQAVSQHLTALRTGGLVVSTADGARRIYRLDPTGIAAMHAYLTRVWEAALTDFQKAADAAGTEQP
jgi:DNA-binding transcriptional ArsR family regulator